MTVYSVTFLTSDSRAFFLNTHGIVNGTVNSIPRMERGIIFNYMDSIETGT